MSTRSREAEERDSGGDSGKFSVDSAAQRPNMFNKVCLSPVSPNVIAASYVVSPDFERIHALFLVVTLLPCTIDKSPPAFMSASRPFVYSLRAFAIPFLVATAACARLLIASKRTAAWHAHRSAHSCSCTCETCLPHSVGFKVLGLYPELYLLSFLWNVMSWAYATTRETLCCS